MCTRPLHFWPSMEVNPATGKYRGIITAYDVDYVTEQDFARRDLFATALYCKELKPIEVPCGHCPECLRSKKYSWLGRCLAEIETTPHSYFVTLTYDDLHLVKAPEKKAIQNFVNRLRKFIKFRYLAVGELGEKTNRAHYHMILFSQDPLEDLKILKRDKAQPLYRSELLERCWDYKGFVSVGDASGPSVAYTLGYLVTKEKKTCFKLQSQGLGAKYFSSLDDRYAIGNGRGEAILVSLPRYLKEKYGIRYEYDYDKQKMLWNNKVFSSGLSDREYRDFKEFLDSNPVNKSAL